MRNKSAYPIESNIPYNPNIQLKDTNNPLDPFQIPSLE